MTEKTPEEMFSEACVMVCLKELVFDHLSESGAAEPIINTARMEKDEALAYMVYRFQLLGDGESAEQAEFRDWCFNSMKADLAEFGHNVN